MNLMIRIRFLFSALILAAAIGSPLSAQTRPEYRAWWIETFNTPLGTRADLDRVVDAAVQSNSNVLLAQVRRRGDSWYLDTKEPLTQQAGVGEPDGSGRWTIDPLRVLIEKAHAKNIEVHAYVIVGSIYNAHPTITGTPKDPSHVFNQHFFDSSRGSLFARDDPRQWSTRSLPHNLESVTFDGHRYGAEWYIHGVIDSGRMSRIDVPLCTVTVPVEGHRLEIVWKRSRRPLTGIVPAEQAPTR